MTDEGFIFAVAFGGRAAAGRDAGRAVKLGRETADV
jgi:hypothetical protein